MMLTCCGLSVEVRVSNEAVSAAGANRRLLLAAAVRRQGPVLFGRAAAVPVSCRVWEPFRSRRAFSGVSPQRIADWRVASANLGAPGHAGYLSRQFVKWVLYPRSVGQPVRSLFEAIEQDEGTGPFATPPGG